MTRKKIIDGDNMKVLKYFDAEDTDSIVEHYKNVGKWDDVSVDIDGDVILTTKFNLKDER